MEPAREETVSLVYSRQTDDKTLCYEGTITLSDAVTLGEVEILHNGELARLWIDEADMGTQMWKPYRFTCGGSLAAGDHAFRVAVTAGLSSKPVQAPTYLKLQLI